MIEVIYKEEKKEASGKEGFFRIPRNIRQIGEHKGSHKIYMEDYVNTFLEKLAATGSKEGRTAILVGEINWQEGISYTFVRGAILVEGLDAAPEKVAFTEEIWAWIEERQKQYFPQEEVVGWFYTRPDLPMVVSDSFYRAHLHYFGGGDKIFVLKDAAEQEEAFFLYDNGQMQRQSGYYIYYEKNQQMQEYMITVQGSETVDAPKEAEDQAVVNFRRIIAGKKEQEEGGKAGRSPVFLYAASACLALTVLAVGVNYLNNYQKLESAAQQVEQVASTARSSGLPEASEEKRKSSSAARSIEREQEKRQEKTIPEKTIPKETEGETDEQPNAEVSPKVTAAPEKEPVSATPSLELPEESKETGAGKIHESYTIQFGDSLYKISTGKYGTMDMIPEICALNGMSSEDIIYPGETILLP